MKNNNQIHNHLKRQLSKLGLSPDHLPDNKTLWIEFLSRISNSYHDADQDKYILQRSSEVASNEMTALNNRLKEAQKIARIGYWHYEVESDQTYYSDEFYTLFGIPVNTPPPTLEQILAMVHKDDRKLFLQEFDLARKETLVKENEFRLRTPNNPYRWYHLIFYPVYDESKTVKRITGIAMDIENRKQAEENIASLNQQLVTSARKAGMADVATSILHNAGNILNSANVGLSLIFENLEHSLIKNILTVLQMLEDNKDNLGNFTLNDPKGKLILPYLISIKDSLNLEFKKNNDEINNLVTHLNHIREIIDMQQNISGNTTLLENISLKETVETALKMSTHKLGNNNIEIDKNFYYQDFIKTDKSKVLQILVNLLQNAKDAIFLNPENNDKKIKITVINENENKIKLMISDSGIGIDPKDKIKIFSFGFTKKEGGHGYGLHASALFAKELGGALELESEGLGKGATFILSLPLDPSDIIKGTSAC
jgi:signal transduction histidine kinase